MKEYLNDIIRYEDGKLYWKKRKKGVTLNKQIGYIDKTGYRSVRIDGKLWKEHKIIWIMFNGEIPDGFQIDHINRQRDDNRIENLRLLTRSMNLINNSRSNIYIRQDRTKKYEAHCTFEGKRQYKTFEKKEDAEKWVETFKNSHIDGGYCR